MIGRERIIRAFNNEPVDRVPMGFWKHFVVGPSQFKGLEDESILDRTSEEHIRYFNEVKPDMMKIMSEGFFGYPPIMNNPLCTGEDLLKIKSIGKDHPWIKKQIAHVRNISGNFKDSVAVFYNIFAPLQVIRLKFDFLDHEYDKFVYLAEHYPKELQQAGFEIQKDINYLVQGLFDAEAIDGIYYCVQNIQSKKFDRSRYAQLIKPTEIEVLENANNRSNLNILHICGYAHHSNDLETYLGYEAKTYNWACHTEGISLEEGKKLFNGKCVLGGFDNNPETILDTAPIEELQEEAGKLVSKNAYNGFVLGADCSLPDNFNPARLVKIREVLEQRSN